MKAFFTANCPCYKILVLEKNSKNEITDVLRDIDNTNQVLL